MEEAGSVLGMERARSWGSVIGKASSSSVAFSSSWATTVCLESAVLVLLHRTPPSDGVAIRNRIKIVASIVWRLNEGMVITPSQGISVFPPYVLTGPILS